MESIYLKIDGMSCGSCVNAVTKALTAVPGVSSVGVSLSDGTARIEGIGLNAPVLEAALVDAGYDGKVIEKVIADTAVSSKSARPGGCGSSKSHGGCCCG